LVPPLPCRVTRLQHEKPAGSLALGVWPRLAAAALAATIVPTTLAGHPYWRMTDLAARRQQRVHFFKNVGLFGGALLVIAERPRRRQGR
jgi:putative oxidoreductase